MSHEWRVTGRPRYWAGYTAIGIVALVVAGPAGFAQEGVPGQSASAGTGPQTIERQTHPRPDRKTGISLVVPLGRVSVGPTFLDGDDIHVRRMTVSEGMAIVELSTTPFVPALPSNEEPRGVGRAIVRPDQPASW